MENECYWNAPFNECKGCMCCKFIPPKSNTFDEYWKIQDSHGHTGKTIIHQVNIALEKINADDKVVRWRKFRHKMDMIGKFKFRLVDLKHQARRHSKHRLYSNIPGMKVKKYVDKWKTGEYTSDGEEDTQ